MSGLSGDVGPGLSSKDPPTSRNIEADVGDAASGTGMGSLGEPRVPLTSPKGHTPEV